MRVARVQSTRWSEKEQYQPLRLKTRKSAIRPNRNLSKNRLRKNGRNIGKADNRHNWCQHAKPFQIQTAMQPENVLLSDRDHNSNHQRCQGMTHQHVQRRNGCESRRNPRGARIAQRSIAGSDNPAKTML